MGSFWSKRGPPQRKLSELKEVFAEAIKDPKYRHITGTGGSLPEEEELELVVSTIRGYREVLGLERGARVPSFYTANLTAPARYDNH